MKAMEVASSHHEIPGWDKINGTGVHTQDNGPGKRSTSEWVFLVDGAVVAYDSTAIKRVVTSSTEAECAAMTTVVRRTPGSARCISLYQGCRRYLQPQYMGIIQVNLPPDNLTPTQPQRSTPVAMVG